MDAWQVPRASSCRQRNCSRRNRGNAYTVCTVNDTYLLSLRIWCSRYHIRLRWFPSDIDHTMRDTEWETQNLCVLSKTGITHIHVNPQKNWPSIGSKSHLVFKRQWVAVKAHALTTPNLVFDIFFSGVWSGCRRCWPLLYTEEQRLGGSAHAPSCIGSSRHGIKYLTVLAVVFLHCNSLDTPFMFGAWGTSDGIGK